MLRSCSQSIRGTWFNMQREPHFRSLNQKSAQVPPPCLRRLCRRHLHRRGLGVSQGVPCLTGGQVAHEPFQHDVKEDGAERAPLLDTTLLGNVGCVVVPSSPESNNGTTVYVSDHTQ